MSWNSAGNNVPPYRVDEDRVAVCFLYLGREAMPGEQLGDLFSSLIG